MNLPPIISALRKHKAGAILIAVQIALTLSIVCNAIFIISQRMERISRPTGLEENSLFYVTQQWVGHLDPSLPADVAKFDAMQREDISALERIPDVASVASLSTLPLLNMSRDASINLISGQPVSAAHTVFYFGDNEMLTALGLHLVEGRSFRPDEVVNQVTTAPHDPSVIIVTSALAKQLFPDGSAVGKQIYFDGGTKPATIIGIVERLQVSTTHNWANNFTWNSTLVPIRLDASSSSYAVRAKPGRLSEAINAAPGALYGLNPMRVLDDASIRTYPDIRRQAYRDDIGMAIIMGVICAVLIALTAAGVIALSSFWVAQRHKQIGIRRALGARKIDIFVYFHMENLFISGVGALFGIVGAFALNNWLMSRYELDRISPVCVFLGVVIVMMLSQLAVFMPARRASSVSPIAATRV